MGSNLNHNISFSFSKTEMKYQNRVIARIILHTVVFLLFPFLLYLTKFVFLLCLQGLWDMGSQEATLFEGKLKYGIFTSSLRLFVLNS